MKSRKPKILDKRPILASAWFHTNLAYYRAVEKWYGKRAARRARMRIRWGIK